MKLTRKYIPLLAILLLLFITACTSDDEKLPSNKTIAYENPVEVIINGYTDHAMEPFLSPNGQTLFFNSQNTGINTKLYYATRISDTEFEFQGEVIGANESQTNQLNAVPDMDETNQFYWTSLREYPTKLDNLHFGTYANGTVTNVGRVQGDFYVGQEGWLVMDHGISFDGQTLFYNNARFDDENCTGPCETFLGMAKKESNGVFKKIANSTTILAQINDPNYIYYAPAITKDELELYYSRYLAANPSETTVVEICVATRTDKIKAFGMPTVLFSSPAATILEAATLSADKKRMYYHQKINGNHKIFVRTRE
tara:strand:- start:12013 stop:12948 length:936 start_codon:yes stop_codon:yes gene_type:complete